MLLKSTRSLTDRRLIQQLKVKSNDDIFVFTSGEKVALHVMVNKN